MLAGAPSLDWVPFLTYGRLRQLRQMHLLTGGLQMLHLFGPLDYVRSERAPDLTFVVILSYQQVLFTTFLLPWHSGIFWGEGRPLFLEMPAQVGSGFMICFTLILVWTITDYCRRKRRSAFISQYYCLGGVFWLVWAFSIAQMIIGREPSQVSYSCCCWLVSTHMFGLG